MKEEIQSNSLRSVEESIPNQPGPAGTNSIADCRKDAEDEVEVVMLSIPSVSGHVDSAATPV